MGCDGSDRPIIWDCPISIHAPAWGATYRSVRDNLHGGISIHAPAWGATRDNQSVVGREGISIHAPAWGATRPCFWSPRIAAFQSTHPRGVRRSAFQSPSARLIFQSTHPRGVRPDTEDEALKNARISIHAPAWGATAKVYKIICKKK